MIKLFRELETNEVLCLGADPGESISYAAAVLISKKYNDIPLTFKERVESPQFGIELHSIGLYVKKKTGHHPLLGIERNIGAATIEKVRNLGYPLSRLYRQRTFDRFAQKEEERIGWMTTSANRRKMLDEFAMLVRMKDIKNYDKEIISEMLTFIIHARTGQPRPESGCYSDLIMAAAIANQMTKIEIGGGTWAPLERRQSNKFLPKKAKDFIVERYDPDERRDWRSL